jgi:hypothetical protein
LRNKITGWVIALMGESVVCCPTAFLKLGKALRV